MKSTAPDHTRHPGNFQDYVETAASPGNDQIPALRAAINDLHAGKTHTLTFPKGEYHFHASEASEKFCFVSNNHEGLKRIAFSLEGLTGVCIDGSGSRFVFHGRVCPFHLSQCRDIILKNFSIDYERATFSQGEIIRATEDFVEMRMDTGCSYFMEHGRIWFDGPNYIQGSYGGTYFRRDAYLHALEFDTQLREPAYMARDHHRVPAHRISETAPGILKLDISYPKPLPTAGNTLVLTHDHRDLFGICIDECERITLSNITIHHAGAMGFIAQRSNDLELINCQVCPPPGGKRMVSTFADASHFVSCGRKIRLSGCRFTHMMDDPVNVHGIYSPISRIISPTRLVIENAHDEQAGVTPFNPGSPIRIINHQTLLPKVDADIARIEPINRYKWLVELTCPLSDQVHIGDCLESLEYVPDLEIENCHFGNNRARGILVTTAGKVRIHNNFFHNAGSAIKISGDANSWYESGAVRDVEIRENLFDNCGYGVWGQGIIAIDPEIQPEYLSAGYYHQNIRIERNTFRTFHDELILARSVNGLTIRENTVESTSDYPAKNSSFERQKLEHCTNVVSQFDP